MNLIRIAQNMRTQLSSLQFARPITHVYNPLEYAWDAYRMYTERYGTNTSQIVLLGMNPGPWGMAQTGVPFGEIGYVRDWLRIHTEIGTPKIQHPKRPIQGFACSRSEVSGQRIWGWAKHTFQQPETFFRRFFVMNYCPLLFMEESGKNRTPDKLPARERDPLTEICDEALRRTIDVLHPSWVIGVGKFAETRARQALTGLDVSIGRILHPSPASPLANKGWAEIASKQLQALGIELPSYPAG